MNFLNELQENILENYNKSTTENGGIGFGTTGKSLLDMNYKLSSYRNVGCELIFEDWLKAFDSNKSGAIKFAFYIRDRVEGAGERRTFRAILKGLAKLEPKYVKALLEEVPEYGRWDDLFVLLDTDLKDDVLNLMAKQMIADYKKMEEGKPISLLAKWLPSINTSCSQTRQYALMLIEKLKQTDRTFDNGRYRKAVSKMRQYIDVVERKMCANHWDKIKYEAVPSKANLIYSDAFMRHDKERRTEYLEALKRGEKKINASRLFPYEIYCKVRESSNDTFEEMWKALPDLKNNTESVLVVADGSGSMSWGRLGDTNVTALDVANSLAIYFAERAKGEFRNHYITFSSNPQLVSLGENTALYEKKRIALRYNECSNTNIEKTFDLILTTALKAEMKQEDMPSTILILSDMEFDNATTSHADKALFKTIEDKFNAYNYKLPRLVFWNICSRTNTIPVITNDLGVALVSGFNTSIFDMVLNNKTDPFEILLDKINSPRYDRIGEIIEGLEG